MIKAKVPRQGKKHLRIHPDAVTNPSAGASGPGSLLVDAGMDPVIGSAVCTNVVFIGSGLATGGDPLELLFAQECQLAEARRRAAFHCLAAALASARSSLSFWAATP